MWELPGSGPGNKFFFEKKYMRSRAKANNGRHVKRQGRHRQDVAQYIFYDWAICFKDDSEYVP